MVTRDIVAIKSVGVYFKKQSEELEEIKNNLTNIIKEIENQFIGKDSGNIINKLESIIKELNLYLENINYYGNFMVELANHDTEIISKTKKNLLNIGVNNE